ncbi:hypothetical protein [Priestia koreensis]|uniref:hypothetical protein n=1 Tax=Priestia koreensis TaxID=284581 RepID=UPI0020412AB1|nr:hypothetical protein [Priestia koreensis]MCM3006318.1 hypothetical protein [Priestia koreensis]
MIDGAKWWEFDFHCHTPASIDYAKGVDQEILKSKTSREWLLDCMSGKSNLGIIQLDFINF